MKDLRWQATVLVGATAIGLAIGELILRQVFPLPLPSPAPQVRYDSHPSRRFALRPDQEAFTYAARVRVDQDGLRVTPGAPAPSPGNATVVALGDSFTFGMGVADDETWPARLQRHLNSADARAYRVVNMGTISYGVQQETDLFVERGLALRPQVVVHGLYWNDYMDPGPVGPGAPSPLTADGYFVWDPPAPQSGLGRLKAWVRDHSVLAFVGMQVLKSTFADRGTSHYEKEYQALVRGEIAPGLYGPVEAFYRELKALGERDGFAVYAIVFPVFGVVEAGNPEGHAYSITIRDMMARLDIPYLDGLALWRARGLGVETYLPYNRHLGAEGYDVIAGAIAGDIKNLVARSGSARSNASGSD